jgi:hypothetical protein
MCVRALGAGLVFVHGGALGAELAQTCVAEGGGEEFGRVSAYLDHEGCDGLVGDVTANGCCDVGCETPQHGRDGALDERRGFRLVLSEAACDEVQNRGKVDEP